MSNQYDAKEVYNWLTMNDFITLVDGEWMLNKKFHEATAIYTNPNLGVAKKDWQLALLKTEADWEAKFIKLIVDAQVPRQLEDNRGGVYYANKYSTEGLKVFKKALQSGVDYDILVKSVMLYYKSNVRYKKAVGNYFTQGDWRTDYEALLSSAEQGIDSLTKHIKTETQDGATSQYKY